MGTCRIFVSVKLNEPVTHTVEGFYDGNPWSLSPSPSFQKNSNHFTSLLTAEMFCPNDDHLRVVLRLLMLNMAQKFRSLWVEVESTTTWPTEEFNTFGSTVYRLHWMTVDIKRTRRLRFRVRTMWTYLYCELNRNDVTISHKQPTIHWFSTTSTAEELTDSFLSIDPKIWGTLSTFCCTIWGIPTGNWAGEVPRRWRWLRGGGHAVRDLA